jgi:hypothetical protein
MRLGTPIALAAVALGATGCSSSAPSKGSFAFKADAICASAHGVVGKLPTSGGVAAVNSEEANLSLAITKLHVLSPPYDRAPQFQAYVYELEYVQALLRDLVRAQADHDTAKADSIEAQVQSHESAGKSSAIDAGLKGCG